MSFTHAGQEETGARADNSDNLDWEGTTQITP